MSVRFSNKTVVLFETHPIWSKTIALWLRHYGIRDIQQFGEHEPCLEYLKEHSANIDCFITNYIIRNETSQYFIKKTRAMYPKLLIVALSANFITDDEVLDTFKMRDALMAGANRVSIKDMKCLKEILEEHFALRESELYDEMEDGLNNIINKSNNKDLN